MSTSPLYYLFYFHNTIKSCQKVCLFSYRQFTRALDLYLSVAGLEKEHLLLILFFLCQIPS
nr:MAG TPA: hypothetical protein [Caudoviricetes sp.]DAQ06371.1 MAG TPA: hypothetical protein [Caudoviricetes sp.]